MTIAPDLVAQILRLHTVEKWRVGTIARQLHVHRDAVRRVLAGNSAPVPSLPSPSRLRPSRIDPYRPFIVETLSKFPTLTAARVHDMIAARGYTGCSSHLRLLVAGMRPRPVAQAYLRLRTLPGEQAQVDWAHFGHLQIGRARRPLMAFVMVLSNIGYQAVLAGHTALFTTAGQLLGELAALDSDSALRRRLRQYAAPDLLVIDEVGYLSFSNRYADLLHRAEVVRIDGESYRAKEAQERDAQRHAERVAKAQAPRLRKAAQ